MCENQQATLEMHIPCAFMHNQKLPCALAAQGLRRVKSCWIGIACGTSWKSPVPAGHAAQAGGTHYGVTPHSCAGNRADVGLKVPQRDSYADGRWPAPVRTPKADGKHGAYRPRKPVGYRPGSLARAHRRNRRGVAVMCRRRWPPTPAPLPAHHARHPARAPRLSACQSARPTLPSPSNARSAAPMCAASCALHLRLYGTPIFGAPPADRHARGPGPAHLHRLCG